MTKKGLSFWYNQVTFIELSIIMKKWQIGGILTTLIIALVLMSGCINQSTAKNSSGSINPNVITTAMLTPSQCYKTADHVNYANSVYEYGFKMDYPC